MWLFIKGLKVQLLCVWGKSIIQRQNTGIWSKMFQVQFLAASPPPPPSAPATARRAHVLRWHCIWLRYISSKITKPLAISCKLHQQAIQSRSRKMHCDNNPRHGKRVMTKYNAGKRTTGLPFSATAACFLFIVVLLLLLLHSWNTKTVPSSLHPNSSPNDKSAKEKPQLKVQFSGAALLQFKELSCMTHLFNFFKSEKPMWPFCC